MSAALNARADTSTQSSVTVPDISLGSLNSTFSTPARKLRIPSTSTGTTAISPPSGYFAKKGAAEATPERLGRDGDDGEGHNGDVLDTPDGRKEKWEDDAATPAKPKGTRSRSKGGVNLTLRDQEKHIDALKKENFNIKLKVHFLEERLAQLAPDQIDAALKQNINLKIEVQQRGMELKKLKKLVLELQRELDHLQRGSGGASGRARELEEKLEERERELRDLRRRRMVGLDDGALRDLEARNAELEEELENVRQLLEENTEELERLRELAESRGDHSSLGNERWRRQAEELEAENEDLRARIDELEEAVTVRTDERDNLADEIEALELKLEEIHRRREAESIERSESRAQILEERESREAVEDDLNAVRDKLAAAQIEMQQKEDEIDMKNREIEELIAEHQRIVETVEDDWRAEVEEVKGQNEELRDALEQRDIECKELRLHIDEYEANAEDLHQKFEATLAHLEHEAEEKDNELEAANRDLEKISNQLYALEEEHERLKEEMDRVREDEAVERERLEQLAAALKQKVASLKADLEEVTDLYNARDAEAQEHRARKEELAQHIEKVVQELQRERAVREGLEADLDKTEKDHEDALRRERRALEAKDSALQSALNDLSRSQSLLTQREADLAAVQAALQTLEADNKKLGESHTTARFSLQLEVDRLRRDVERLEDELARARKELDDREGKGRDRDGVIDRLHAENRDLAAQLAAQTQARMNISEKLDASQASLRAAETETTNLRTRIAELEQRLSKDQRALLAAEAQYRDQLTERNTLLLTIYQYMDKIVGVDKTPKKHGQAETKPFTNFSVFHDNLITRLKALSQIQSEFEKRVKEAEQRYSDKLNDMRKQLDLRWKQIDKFEASVKTLAEAKALWRKKLNAKDGEIEALQATNAALQSHVVTRKGNQADSMEIRSLTARAQNAERRAINLQNQLLQSEEKLTAVNQKTTAADNKWEARVKEYETRLKTAEEKIKRERQGGKERALELENQLKSLQRQLELANKRTSTLNEIIESAGLPSKNSPNLSK
ncbi:hypothetical protein L226DRAFT_505884 [Lentinus tigrinus ALCF2SS1-7]|uniref:Centrosomin N-terminal motif 1 domain-containing protein n=1 Tax=Lentinus tigrinus ALCF2SS1-6 TaxID=1328759 RepID=A0A5C2SK90_9APHY|nr:hypothetical protein L227DRAFT_571856 [Lentinus tigrinus ALCF2SS1-6]RPD76484.1 hypothetical protein L226DRAFT_505884 [Lentinus tigrinus ALCF2SS1-7]